jgi:STE24 endopeptidase
VANEDKATRYHRLQRRVSVTSTALSVLLFLVLLLTGWSAMLRDSAASIAGPSFVPVVIVYVMFVALLSEAAQLPLAFYRGVTLERRYGLSTETTARWWRDHFKAGGISLLFGIAAALIVWSLLRWSPERWWLLAAACFSVILVGLAQLTPVVLLPLFYESRPLDRPSLVSRLVALADRAGAHVLGVFELRVSDKTRKANAALAGVGRTRRILLSDTLLAEHSDDEIEVILAHELAHHVHRDIVQAIVLETALITLGFYLSDRLLESLSTRFALTGKSDIAALPLLVLTFGAVSLLLLPLANAMSRAHERRADRYALEMTGNVPAFVSAMKRLGATNLAEERPSRLVEILFHSHPPMAARIAAAQEWIAKGSPRHPS